MGEFDASNWGTWSGGTDSTGLPDCNMTGEISLGYFASQGLTVAATENTMVAVVVMVSKVKAWERFGEPCRDCGSVLSLDNYV